MFGFFKKKSPEEIAREEAEAEFLRTHEQIWCGVDGCGNKVWVEKGSDWGSYCPSCEEKFAAKHEEGD